MSTTSLIIGNQYYNIGVYEAKTNYEAKKAVQCSITIKVNTCFISCLILINFNFYYNTCLLLHNIMLIYCAEFNIKSLQIINIFEYIVGPTYVEHL